MKFCSATAACTVVVLILFLVFLPSTFCSETNEISKRQSDQRLAELEYLVRLQKQREILLKNLNWQKIGRRKRSKSFGFLYELRPNNLAVAPHDSPLMIKTNRMSFLKDAQKFDDRFDLLNVDTF